MSTTEDIEAAVAKLEIQEALARYARGIDRQDVELAKSAYHPDATDEHGGPFHGNAHEVMDRVARILADQEFCRHQISNVSIQLNGDRANVESYHFSLHVPNGSDVEDHVYGRYLDVFEKRDENWKILERRVVVDYSFLRARTEPIAAQERFIRGRRDRQDPSYEFFGTE